MKAINLKRRKRRSPLGILSCLLLFMAFLSASPLSADAQEKKALLVGDTIPDSLWNKPFLFIDMNGREKIIRLSDYDDRLVILDFWATWCGSCIAKFPESMQLQQKFQGKLDFILVNSGEDIPKLKNFLMKRPSLKRLGGSVAKSEQLRDFFPYSTIPHFVWIKNKKVMAITKADRVKETYIASMLLAGKPSIAQAQERKMLDISRPLFVNGNGELPMEYKYRSFVTGYVDGIQGVYFFSKKGKDTVTGYHHVNRPLKSLYLAAYPELRNIHTHHTVYETKQPEYFKYEGDFDEWMRKYYVTYDLTCPPVGIDSARALMRADLDRYFNFRLYADERMIECFVLSIPSAEALRTKPPAGITKETNIQDRLGDAKYLYGYPLGTLTMVLGNRYFMPFLDESGFQGEVYLDLPSDLTEEPALIASLAKQGIVLKKEKRKMRVLVIADK